MDPLAPRLKFIRTVLVRSQDHNMFTYSWIFVGVAFEGGVGLKTWSGARLVRLQKRHGNLSNSIENAAWPILPYFLVSSDIQSFSPHHVYFTSFFAQNFLVLTFCFWSFSELPSLRVRLNILPKYQIKLDSSCIVC